MLPSSCCPCCLSFGFAFGKWLLLLLPFCSFGFGFVGGFVGFVWFGLFGFVLVCLVSSSGGLVWLVCLGCGMLGASPRSNWSFLCHGIGEKWSKLIKVIDYTQLKRARLRSSVGGDIFRRGCECRLKSSWVLGLLATRLLFVESSPSPALLPSPPLRPPMKTMVPSDLLWTRTPFHHLSACIVHVNGKPCIFGLQLLLVGPPRS